MTCSPENLHNLFYNFSTFSFLLLLLLYFFSSLLLKLLNFIGSYPIIQRNQNGYEYNLLSDEEEEEEEEERNDTNYFYTAHSEKEYFMADTIQGGGECIELLARSFSIRRNKKDHVEEFMKPTSEGTVEDTDDSFASDEQLSILAAAGDSESDHDDEEEMETSDHADPVHDSFANRLGPTSPISMHLRKRVLIDSDRNIGGTTN